MSGRVRWREPSLAIAAWLAAALTPAGCGGSREVGPITDPDTDWPRSILELGTIDDGGRWRPDGDTALAYEVGYPLWSGGTDKRRHIVLPDGAQIDARDRGRWVFAAGTVAFKTFFDGDRPLETRALRQLGESGWEYVAYLWDADGQGAELLPLDEPVAIELDRGGVHTVPVATQCRDCHAVGESPMLGVQELQLASARSSDSGGSELERFDSLGLLAGGAPDEPAIIDHPDPGTAAVLGWFVGNCSHCHDGSEREGTSFDLSPGAALASTVNQPTESSASAAGIRIVPGSPAESILYLAVSGEHDNREIQDMPPVGIDRRDQAGIAALREMIEGIEP